MNFLDFLFPRHCAICGKRLETDEEALCIMCNAMLSRVGWMKTPYDNPLAISLLGRIEIEKAASLTSFTPGVGSARMVYAKYFNDRGVCSYIGKLMGQEAVDCCFIDGIDIVVPMPLAPGRELHRGFNQCDLIAEGFSKATGLPASYKSMGRKRFSRSQTSLARQQRINNVENAFYVIDPSEIEGKHVLLVDDVITTGATSISCGKEILKVPNTRLSVLSFGKTV